MPPRVIKATVTMRPSTAPLGIDAITERRETPGGRRVIARRGHANTYPVHPFLNAHVLASLAFANSAGNAFAIVSSRIQNACHEARGGVMFT
jgi:hypothetical protein